MQIKRCVLCVLAAVMLSTFSAHAEFSDSLAALYADYENGGSVTVRYGMQLGALPSMGEEEMALLNALLEKTAMEMSVSAQSDMSHALVTFDGKSILNVTREDMPNEVFTSFGGASTYRTLQGERDALELLADGEVNASAPFLIDVGAAVRGIAASGERIASVLLSAGATEKRVQDATSLKNVGTAPIYVSYVLPEEGMNACREEIISLLTEALRPSFALMPDLYQTILSQLNGISFSGDCTYRRLLAKDESDMGFRFSGIVLLQGDDARKVSILCGEGDKGLYVSLALPARKGKNTLKAVLTGSLTQEKNRNRLEFSCDVNRIYNDDTMDYALKGNLKNDLTPEGDSITGTLTLSQKKNGATEKWTVKPELAGAGEGLSGTVQITRKAGNDKELSLAMSLSLSAGEAIPAPDKAAVVDLSGLSLTQIDEELSGERTNLLISFYRIMDLLDENARALITHALRTDAWMTAPAVGTMGPASGMPDMTNLDDWTVTEEENSK